MEPHPDGSVSGLEGLWMADEPNKLQSVDGPLDDPVIMRLIKETGITQEQAREIVSLLGTVNWSSLMREARLIKPKR
ncbi:hypothetical protein [Mesorhizobium amorphae]|uniref:hypothetical protein n=1 Tax=Mesorhizobium amorphae TaxID=71433 RepID=UPI00177C7F06|nr:hypothetical protein [Mesorhizobium amorphae]